MDEEVVMSEMRFNYYERDEWKTMNDQDVV